MRNDHDLLYIFLILIVISTTFVFFAEPNITGHSITDNIAPIWSGELTKFTIDKNKQLTINLDNHFTDENNDELAYIATSASNLNIEINNNLLTITPEKDFIGSRLMSVFAEDNLTVTSQQIRIEIIGEPGDIPKIPEPIVKPEKETQEEKPKEKEQGQSFNENQKIKSDNDNKHIGKKIEDEPEFETYFTTIEKTDEKLTIIFHHNSPIEQPIWIEGEVQYTLSKTNAQENENITLIVPTIEGIVPRFKLHIGKESETFEFGKVIPEVKTDNAIVNLIDRNDEKLDIEITKGESKAEVKGIEEISELKAKITNAKEKRIKTEVFTLDSIPVEPSILTLKKTGHVDVILRCNNFDDIAETCIDDWKPTNIPFTDNGNTITFIVNHFSAFAGGTDVNLSIWDDGDIQGGAKLINEQITFHANFTNATGPANTTDGGCEIQFDTGSGYGAFANMIYDSTLVEYNFSQSFGTSGEFSFNVSCNSSNGNLIQSDIFYIQFIPPTAANISCTIRNATTTGGCLVGETKVLAVSNSTNAHSELANQSNYEMYICCQDITARNIIYSNTSGYFATFLNLSNKTNAHVQEFNETGQYNYSAYIGLSQDNISIFYEGTGGNCSEGYCIATISSPTDAHIASCTEGTYDISICANVTSFTNVCGNYNSDVTLTQSISSSSTCINITADDVTVNCAGFTIMGKNNGDGIFARNKKGIAIENCSITNFTQAIALNITNNSMIKNNSLFNNTRLGILIYNTKNNTIISNTISNNTVMGMYIHYSNNTNITSNTVHKNINNPIRLEYSYHNTVEYNSMFNNENTGFSLFSTCENNTIHNNTAYNNQGTAGFRIASSTHNKVIDNIAFNNTGSGFLISGAYNNLTNNKAYNNTQFGFSLSGAIAGNGTLLNNSAFENTWNGFDISSSHNTTLINNTAYNNSRIGFSIANANFIEFINNTANDNSWEGFRILVSSTAAENITLTQCRASGNSRPDINITDNAPAKGAKGILLNDSTFSTYDFYLAGLIIENSSAGQIRFLNTSITASGNNLAQDIMIRNNSIFVNTTNSAGLNTTANLTLYNIHFINPEPLVDYDDDGTFAACLLPVCSELGYTGTTYIFNVSTFTTYKAQDGIYCGKTLTSSTTLLENLGCNGTALYINSSSITLDCDGFTIFGNSSGDGIKVTDANTTTIKNCIVHNFTNNINIDPSIGDIIENNTVENASVGILLTLTNASRIKNNTMRNCTRGIKLLESSYNNLTLNYANDVLYGIETNNNSHFNWIDNNTVINMSVIKLKNYENAFGISVNGNNNTISNNTLLNGTAPSHNNNHGISLGEGIIGAEPAASGNLVTQNTIYNLARGTSDGAGIEISFASNNTIEFNTIYNLNDISGIGISWHENIIRNNTIYSTKQAGINLGGSGNGNDNNISGNLIYNISGSAGVVSGIGIMVDHEISRDNIFENTIYNCSTGIKLGQSWNTNEDGMLLHKLWNNTIYNNSIYGIFLRYGESVTIDNNLVYDNGYAGILINASDYSNVTNCIVHNNSIGIYIEEGVADGGGTGNIVSNNSIFNNSDIGIKIDKGSDETITNNSILSNDIGIFINNAASSNNITNNIVKNSSTHSINLTNSDNNLIYNNYFEQKPAADSASTGNSWNITKTAGTNIINGTFLGGNFWLNYPGIDNDGDGLGDTDTPWTGNTSEIINGGDYLPLTNNTNNAPNTTTVLINSTFTTNFTEENFTCWTNITDDFNTTIIAQFKWFNNSEVYSSGSVSITASALENISTIDSSITSIGENWTCEVKGIDGTQNESTGTNSSEMIIQGCGNLNRNLDLIEKRQVNGTACFNMTSNNIQLDCKDYNINGNGTSTSDTSMGITAYLRNNITITSCNITSSRFGIFINQTTNATITHNHIFNNSEGIRINDSNNGITYIYNNTISNQVRNAILSKATSNSIIANNTMLDNGHSGIRIEGEFDNNTIANNTINNSGAFSSISNVNVRSRNNNNYINNYISGSSQSGIRITRGSNTIIKDNTITHNGKGSNYGIYLFNFNNSQIYNNTIIDNGYGLHFTGYATSEQCYNNTVYDNIFTNNSNDGLYMHRSHLSDIYNNTFRENSLQGIRLGNSDNISIHTNVMTDNTYNGLYAFTSTNNTIYNNTCINNYNGISLETNANDNFIYNNSLSLNEWRGIGIWTSIRNTIYNNHAFNNSATGIYLINSANANITNNILENNTLDGIYFKNSENNSFADNLAKDNKRCGYYYNLTDNSTFYNGSSNNNSVAGFCLDNSRHNIFSNITFENELLGFKIFTTGSGFPVNNTLKNLTFINNIATLHVIDSFNNSIDDSNLASDIIFEDSSFGLINYSSSINFENKTVFMDVINITNNMIHVDTVNAPHLNQSAILKFTGLSFIDPIPTADFNENGTFDDCSASVCSEISYDGSTYFYSVTHFTNYSSKEGNANMSLTKADNPDPVYNGNTLTYTITYANNGNSNATNVTIRDVYDENITFTSSIPSPDAGTNETWTIGNVAQNETGTIVITTQVNGNIIGNITNFANLTYSNSSGQNITETITITTTSQEAPATTPSTGGGGGGATRRLEPIAEEVETDSGMCVEDWICNSWTSCIDNQQTRECFEGNECDTEQFKPPTSRECTPETGPELETPSMKTIGIEGLFNTCAILPYVIYGLLILLILFMIIYLIDKFIYKKRLSDKLERTGEYIIFILTILALIMLVLHSKLCNAFLYPGYIIMIIILTILITTIIPKRLKLAKIRKEINLTHKKFEKTSNKFKRINKKFKKTSKFKKLDLSKTREKINKTLRKIDYTLKKFKKR